MANYGDQKAAYSLAATASSGMRAPAFARSSRPAFFLLALLWTYLQAVPCGAQGAILVRSSAELAAAFVNQNVSVIYLNDSITVDGNWSETITVTRNVTVRSTEEREAEGVYCLLDFNMRVMLLSLAAGCTLEFRGIELVNHLSEVGPNVKPVRQSVGATILLNSSVQRRRAGLPLAAGLVNLLAGARPEGTPGPQVAYIVQNFTFRSTRSPSPLQYGDAAHMVDYRTATPPDSSLAFQGLYYGGYIYITNYSWYVVDHYVPDSCLKQRSGSECVTLLLDQLDDAASPPPAPGARGGTTGGSSSSNTTTVVVAVVVPVCSVLLLGVLAALLLVRRRRRQQAERYGPGAKPPDGSITDRAGKGDVEAGAGAGSDPRVRAADQGCVFMGLDEDQDLPPWSGLGLEEHADASVHNGSYYPSISQNGIGGVGGGSAAHPSWLSRAEGRVGALEGRMAEMNGKLTEGSGGASNGKAAAGDGTASGGGGGGGLSTEAEVAAAGAAGPFTSGSGERLQPVLASLMAQEQNLGQGQGQGAHTPPATAEGSDTLPGKARARTTLPQELEEMSKGLRTHIRDVQLRLDGVLGTGAYGTVYSGTWQGLPVAVKTLVFSASTDNRRRALQEAALSQSVTHPNIVATYTADVEPLGAIPSATATGSTAQGGSGNNSTDNAKILQDWRLYIVQEFCDGGPLRTLYGDKSLWPAPGANMVVTVSLALGIANALAHLHSKRIVHGDLNPNNVLLKRDPTAPSGYTVKVGDFGLSVMMPNQKTHISNLRMGTMFYMCPAVVLKAQVGPNSDIFSLGVMLWELYHGRPAGANTRHGPRYSSAFPSFPPTCHPAYRALALHCLQRQPQNRPAAQAVAEALAGLLEVLQAEVGMVSQTPHSPVPSHPASMQGSGTEHLQQQQQ